MIIMAMTMMIIIIIMLMMNKMMEMVSVDIDLPNCWEGFDHPVWWLTDHDDDNHEDYDDENNHVVNRWWFLQVPEDGTTPSESKFWKLPFSKHIINSPGYVLSKDEDGSKWPNRKRADIDFQNLSKVGEWPPPYFPPVY